jgi:Domain of unknown function (DUF1707)
MAGHSEEMGAGEAGRGRLRASDSDREQVIEVLKTAFVQGRLARDELDQRVSQALISLTYADLARIIADIPAGLAPARPVTVLARAPRRPAATEVQTGLRVSGAAAVLAAALWAIGILTANVVVLLLACGATGTVFVASFLTGTRMLGSWLDQRSGGPAPPLSAPPAANQPSRPSASPALPPVGHDRRSLRPGWPQAVALIQ